MVRFTGILTVISDYWMWLDYLAVRRSSCISMTVLKLDIRFGNVLFKYDCETGKCQPDVRGEFHS